MKLKNEHSSYWMSENWEVPPFYSTGEDDIAAIPLGFVRLSVASLPGRYVPRFWADIERNMWEPLWNDLQDANKQAVEVVNQRSADYDRTRKTPILGRFLANLQESQTIPLYSQIERNAWEASRALLLLVEDRARGEQRQHATRYLDMHVSELGARRSPYNPTRT